MKEVTVFEVNSTKMTIDDGANIITYVDNDVDVDIISFKDNPSRPPFNPIRTGDSPIIRRIKNTPTGPEVEYISMHPKAMELLDEESRRRIKAENRAKYFEAQSLYFENLVKEKDAQRSHFLMTGYGSSL